MKSAKAYCLLSAIILSVTVSCKKDEPVADRPQPHLQVHAGYDITVNLPANAVTLNGTVIVGSANKVNWRQIAGPFCRIETPERAISGLTFRETGVYLFEFTATNSDRVKATDSVEITVRPSIDTLDYVSIYPFYFLLHLPQNSVTVMAQAVNSRNPATSPGNVASIQWSKVGGPGSYLVDSPNAYRTKIYNLEEGVHQFSCTLTSTSGFVSTSIATIAVANPSSPNHEVILTNQQWSIVPDGWGYNHIGIDIYNHVPSGKPIKKVFMKPDCFTQWYELAPNGVPGWDEWVYEITDAGTRLNIYHDYCGGDTPDVKIVY